MLGLQGGIWTSEKWVMSEDYYSALGVSKTADAETIKRAYKKLAKDLHPDRNPNNKAAEAKFKSANRAFEILSDPKKRSLYDEFGEGGLREGFDPNMGRARSWGGAGGSGGRVRLEDLFGGGGGGQGDPFADFFGRGGGGRARGPAKGADYEAEVEIGFALAVQGGSIDIRPGGKPVSVKIPVGIEPGSKLKLAGQGAPSSNGGQPGDLLLTIKVASHPQFRREGLDLHLQLPLTLTEAFFGAKVKVPTADGSVTLKVPERTQGGDTLRLRGKGVVPSGKQAGDLYVHFTLELPKSDAPELAQIFEQLRAYEQDDPRKDVAL
jgi:curved DNA-binding protein